MPAMPRRKWHCDAIAHSMHLENKTDKSEERATISAGALPIEAANSALGQPITSNQSCPSGGVNRPAPLVAKIPIRLADPRHAARRIAQASDQCSIFLSMVSIVVAARSLGTELIATRPSGCLANTGRVPRQLMNSL